MKALILFLAAILWLNAAPAQNRATVIKTQAMDMVKSLMKKDYPRFARYMHPKIIEMAGGKDSLIMKMDTVNTRAGKFGAKIKKVLLGHPASVVNYNTELQTTLPQTTELETPLGNIILETTIIAISTDKGKNWYFIDTSMYSVDEVKKSLPNISPDLTIPPNKKPRFVKKG